MLWGGGSAEGDASMRDLLGGKGAGLAEMTNAGLPVPPGFTITTEACNDYFAAGEKLPAGLWDDVLEAVGAVEAETGKGFGDAANPLLVSVRSGAKFSMPGMMDTVLNLGLNDATLEGLVALTGNERFGWDAYRRFIQMFGRIVLDVHGRAVRPRARRGQGSAAASTQDTELDAARPARGGRRRSRRSSREDDRARLPAGPATSSSTWPSRRSSRAGSASAPVDYRDYNKIAHDLGTAVNVVTMVFGNMGDDSGTGVAFTRDPNTGEQVLFGEYLTNAQGEDVVAGIRTPFPIAQMRDAMPEVYAEFEAIGQRLERHYRDMQDLEFTIERGRLYMLQTRSAKRTALAAVRIAADMVEEGIITKEEARRAHRAGARRPAAARPVRPGRPQGAPRASPRASTRRPGAAVGSGRVRRR